MSQTIAIAKAITNLNEAQQKSNSPLLKLLRFCDPPFKICGEKFAISKKFTIVNPQQNELYNVVRVIKRIIDLYRNRSSS